MTFWPNLQESTYFWTWMHNAIAWIMNALGGKLDVPSDMAATQFIIWLWLHSNAVSSYSFCMAAMSAALFGCCICCLLCSKKDGRFQRGPEDSGSIRKTSCKLWYVKIVWGTDRKKVLQRNDGDRWQWKHQVYHLGKRLQNIRK